MKIFLVAILLLAAAAHAEVTSVPIRPSATDPEIKFFDDPHWLYVNRDIVVQSKEGLARDRHELLVWLTGTGGTGHDAQAFSKLAADLGYHVVTLMFPDDIPASVCRSDSNPKAFENFRMAIIQGGSATYQDGRKTISIGRADSIENRLIKLLLFVQNIRPAEHWGQFLNEDGTIKWQSIAVAGQSQGGGHAALLGIKHCVSRVMCFGSPKDYNVRLDAPAAWYGAESVTPKDRFFAFNHHQDPKGCTPEQLLRNQKALGLVAFGLPAEVDTEAFPFHHARMLYTGYPTVIVTDVLSEGARIAHGSAINTKNADHWKQVWMYMLTEPTR